jgi:hypothetical protein
MAEAVVRVCDQCGRPDASTITIRTATGPHSFLPLPPLDRRDRHYSALAGDPPEEPIRQLRVELNDSSTSLKIEFPARKVEVRDKERVIHDRVASRTLILGADAQTLSWSYVLTDFPSLKQSDTPAAKAIAAATSSIDLLSADVLKVSHHASKHGVNLELV